VIAVECYADTAIAKALGVLPRRLLHARGKGQVLAALRDGRAVAGVVDEDPQSLPSLELRNYAEAERYGALRLLRHKTRVFQKQ